MREAELSSRSDTLEKLKWPPLMGKFPGVPHLQAVRALERAGF